MRAEAEAEEEGGGGFGREDAAFDGEGGVCCTPLLYSCYRPAESWLGSFWGDRRHCGGQYQTNPEISYTVLSNSLTVNSASPY